MVGEDVGTRVRQARLQIREAFRAEQQLADYQQRPTLAYEVEGMRGGSPVIVWVVCQA
jgi:hypothetical protein